MSGKRRLSAAGKRLLDAFGKAKLCDCCNPCCDYYLVEMVYTGSDICCQYSLTGITAPFTTGDCGLDMSYPVYDLANGLASGVTLTRSVGVLNLTASLAFPCDPYNAHYFEGPILDCSGGCFPAGSYSIPFVSSDYSGPLCDSPLAVTITPMCCYCKDSCWRYTIVATTPYTGECVDCQQWNYPVEYLPGVPIDCIKPCTDADFGFPVAFCRDPYSGDVYIRASLEVADAGDCGPFYIHYSLATPIAMVGDCPADGTYTLTLDPSHDGEPCDIQEIEVTIEQLSCCELNDETTPNYYISFDYEYHSYYDVDGYSTDCDGNPYGVNQCNVVNSETDMLMVASGGSTLWLDNGAWSPTVDCGSYADVVSIDCIGGGAWELTFELIQTASTIKSGGLTPVGTYPDINICFNDGFVSWRLDITNIVVTA